MFIQGCKRDRGLELHNGPKSAPKDGFEFQIPNRQMIGCRGWVFDERIPWMGWLGYILWIGFSDHPMTLFLWS